LFQIEGGNYNVSESVFPPSDEVEGSKTMLTEGARRATGVSIVWPPLDSPTVLTYKKSKKGGR